MSAENKTLKTEEEKQQHEELMRKIANKEHIDTLHIKNSEDHVAAIIAESNLNAEEKQEQDRIEAEKQKIYDDEHYEENLEKIKAAGDVDLIDLLECHPFYEDNKLLNKLGIKSKKKKRETDPTKMTQEELQAQRIEEERTKKSKEDAKKMISDANAKLDQIKKTSSDLEKQVMDLVYQIKDQEEAMVAAEGIVDRVKQKHEQKIKSFRTKQLAEIFWLMKDNEIVEHDDDEDEEDFYFVIHMYLSELWFEDREDGEQEYAEMDIDEKIVMLFKNFKDQFNEAIAHCKTKKDFKKVMPRPEPKNDEQEENFLQFLEQYEEWADDHYEEEDEDDDDQGILESTTGEDISSVGASVAEQSVAVPKGPTADAIAEVDENQH